jgi:DNA gyrase subunit A
MPDSNTLDQIRADLDYERLIESASPALRRYIKTLEQENARLRQQLIETRDSITRRQRSARGEARRSSTGQVRTVRHPDDVMVVSITKKGRCKRTPLNDYATQRRGGIGIFDIQSDRDDALSFVTVARSDASLLVLSDRGRAFRVPVDTLPLGEIRSRGTSLPGRLMFTGDEVIGTVLALDDERDTRGILLIGTASGWVRSLHRSYVGSRLQPGTLLSDPRRGGPPVAMALSDGQGEVMLAVGSGKGYRFSERLIRREGVRGIQVHPEDALIGLVSVSGDNDQVLLVTADGQGTRRVLSGFAANKTPGGQGKVLIKSDELVGMAGLADGFDVLCVSKQAKIIRFGADEVPAKTGSVQGVNVMDCRGDRLTAMAVVAPPGSS